MKIDISSQSTLLYKYGYSGAILFILVVGNLYTALVETRLDRFGIQLGISLIIAIIAVLWARKIRFVEIVGERLLIKGKNAVTEIGFDQIDSVSQRPWARLISEYVTICYRDTLGKKKIHVIPNQRSFGILEHPLVEKLKAIFRLN